jgi:hypothetical protein
MADPALAPDASAGAGAASADRSPTEWRPRVTPWVVAASKIVFDDPPDRQYQLGPGMSVVPRVRVKS